MVFRISTFCHSAFLLRACDRHRQHYHEADLAASLVHIVLHTRPSCCLRVSSLSITFACHAFCINKSNIAVTAVSRMVAPFPSSLFVLVLCVAILSQHEQRALRHAIFAEGEGFEPPEHFTARLVSSEVPSTARPSFRFASAISSQTGRSESKTCICG